MRDNFTGGLNEGHVTGCTLCLRCNRLWFYYKHSEVPELCRTCGDKMEVVQAGIGEMWLNSEYRNTMSFKEFLRKLYAYPYSKQ